MSPRVSGGFLDEWQNLPRWMIGFGLDRFDRASTCIRDMRVSKLCSARQLADATLLAGDEDDAFGTLTAVSTQARESLRRMRAFVQMLDLRWALGPAVALSLDPACIHMPQHVGETIRKELEMRASSQAYSFDKLWGIILRFWCDCDAREWIGLRKELLAFQRLIALKCQAEPAS